MIEFDVETRRSAPPANADAPARYLILGDFGGRSTNPLAVDRDNFASILEGLDVSLAGTRIRQLDDFHPDFLFQRLSLFGDLREDPPEPAPSAGPAPRPDLEEILRPSSLLEQMAGGGDPFEKYLRQLSQAHAAPASASHPAAAHQARTAALGDRMRGLLRHPRVQSLEAAWRGLDFAVRRIDDESARIYAAQFSARELAADLLSSQDLSATRAFTLLHSRQWSAVFGLFSFSAEASDIELLGRLALLAANTGAPFVAEGSVAMGPYWDQLRSIPEAGYLGLALPRFLLRLPYGARTSPIESFEFEEMPGAPTHSAYLWGNPALACLTLAAGAGDLDLRDLPLHTYQEDGGPGLGEWRSTPCAEVLMTEAQVHALIDLGLMPLVSFRDTDRVRLTGFRAINGQPLPLAA